MGGEGIAVEKRLQREWTLKLEGKAQLGEVAESLAKKDIKNTRKPPEKGPILSRAFLQYDSPLQLPHAQKSSF